MTSSSLQELSVSVDSLWIGISTILVFWMQAGFALVQVGSVRVKNSQNILFKNIFDVCVTTILWWLIGYGMAYGKDKNNFMGTSMFTTADFEQDPSRYRDFMFQWAFSGTMITIVSGAMAERTKILGYILLCIWMNILVYPFIVHWTWGGGWLAQRGYFDFAGSGIVHEVGGVAALMGAILIGSREGRWQKGAEQRFQPHNIPFIVTGTFILWMGWYGFNGGSTLSFTGGNQFIAFKVMLNTTLSAVAAGFVVLIVKGSIAKVFELPFLCNGLLAGLVSITAACDNVTDYEALIIGILGGFIVIGVSYLVKACKIDDAIDAFAVHGACGAWGAIAVGFFHQEHGVFHKGTGKDLGIQIAGVITFAVWTGVICFIGNMILKVLKLHRIGEEHQKLGLDKAEHGGQAYDFNRQFTKEHHHHHDERHESHKHLNNIIQVHPDRQGLEVHEVKRLNGSKLI